VRHLACHWVIVLGFMVGSGGAQHAGDVRADPPAGWFISVVMSPDSAPYTVYVAT